MLDFYRQEVLYSRLTSLGSVYPLRFCISPEEVARQLQPFESNWQPYNQNKPQFKRWGLSVTSLDGGLSGVPDLTSLLEHNSTHATKYNELSFRKLTPVYQACTVIHEFMEPFQEFLGRSHFLRFGLTGGFPFHRDAYSSSPDSFRIFVPLYHHSARDFIFLLDDRRLNFEVGRPYFINTRLEHALFVFDEPSLCLVLNVELSEKSVEKVMSSIFAR